MALEFVYLKTSALKERPTPTGFYCGAIGLTRIGMVGLMDRKPDVQSFLIQKIAKGKQLG